MNDQTELFPHAHARRGDPDTSHEAAASQKAEALSELRLRIYETLREMPQTQLDLELELYGAWSPSGIRTRVSELRKMGKVRDSGKRETLPSGRKAIVWEVVPE